MPVEHPTMEKEGQGNSPRNKIQGDQLQDWKGRNRLVFPKKRAHKRASKRDPSQMCWDSNPLLVRKLLLQVCRRNLPAELGRSNRCKGHNGRREDHNVWLGRRLEKDTGTSWSEAPPARRIRGWCEAKINLTKIRNEMEQHGEHLHLVRGSQGGGQDDEVRQEGDHQWKDGQALPPCHKLCEYWLSVYLWAARGVWRQ